VEDMEVLMKKVVRVIGSFLIIILIGPVFIGIFNSENREESILSHPIT